MNINYLVYHSWDVIFVDLMEMLHLISVQDGIKLELFSHLQEITTKMPQNLKNLIDLQIKLEIIQK
jgi:hypothetical protein